MDLALLVLKVIFNIISVEKNDKRAIMKAS